jgi:hypothetical protein
MADRPGAGRAGTPGRSSGGTDVPELQSLVVRYLDQALGPEELRALNELLTRDPAQRRLFVSTCLQVSLLREAATRVQAPARAWDARTTPAPGRSGTRARTAALATLGLGLAAAAAVALFALTHAPSREPTRAAVPSLTTGAPGADRVAVVSAVASAPGAAKTLPRAGQVLGPGRFDLPSGDVQLDFFSGARVRLVGPVSLDLVSPWRAVLRTGSLAAAVHEGAIGFTVEGPGMKLFDLGTEFAIKTDGAGSAIRVFRGEVEASVLGADGTTLKSALVTPEREARIDPARAALAEATDVTAVEPVASAPSVALPVSGAYVDAVRAARPIGYWRFEGYEPGFIIKNEVASSHGLEVRGDVALERTIGATGASNGVARFPAEVAERHIVARGLPALARGDFTVELWVKPDRIGLMSLASLVVPPSAMQTAYLHLALLELRALEGPLTHLPGAIRFLHRWPPGPVRGSNVFSASPYLPGVWHHVVGVKRHDAITLYLNGALVRSSAVAPGAADMPVDLVLGLLPTYRAGDLRNFVGHLDEVAVYARALATTEIERHFHLMNSTGRGARP